jgi:hypothetical protein
MACGRVLGVHNGMVLEYDSSTLAPLGLVVGKDELQGRQVAVIDSGLNQQDGAQMEQREQYVLCLSHTTLMIALPSLRCLPLTHTPSPSPLIH